MDNAFDIAKDNVKRLERNVNTVNINNVNVVATAYKLQEKLGDTHSLRFFKKVASTLPEAVIWREVETALNVARRPAAYFSATCKTMMETGNYE